jgi:hypothetical protein
MAINNRTKKLVMQIVSIVFISYSLPILSAQPSPTLLWSKSYANTTFYDVAQTSSNNYALLAEYGLQMSEISKIWITAIDSSRNKLWSKYYGIQNRNCYPEKMQLLPDSGFIVTGEYEMASLFEFMDNSWILRLKNNGDTLWTYKINKNDTLSPSYVAMTIMADDGGFVGVGGTPMSDTTNKLPDIPLFFKLDANGHLLWSEHYLMPTKTSGYAEGISLESDGGFTAIVRGDNDTINDTNPNEDLWMLRLDKNGDTLWSKRLNECARQSWH